MEITRRNLLEGAGAAILLSLANCTGRAIPVAGVTGKIKLANVIDIPIKGVMEFKSISDDWDDETIWLYRASGTEYIAVNSTCTHEYCPVNFKEKLSRKLIQPGFYCACHSGYYDINGKVLDGPPKEPLKTYEVVIENGKIFVLKD